jgi:hypothetical protein
MNRCLQGAFALLALTAIACESETGEPAGVATSGGGGAINPTRTPGGPTDTPDVSRCEPASPALIDAISEGLNIAGGGSLTNGFTVRSEDFDEVFFVAAELVGADLDGEVAVWATNRLDGTGSVFSVGGFANEFSDWGDGGATDANLSLDDDGAEEAEDCAEDAG